MVPIEIFNIYFETSSFRNLKKYYNSSTITNRIGRAHKPGKQNRQQPDSTADSSNIPSTTSSCKETNN